MLHFHFKIAGGVDVCRSLSDSQIGLICIIIIRDCMRLQGQQPVFMNACAFLAKVDMSKSLAHVGYYGDFVYVSCTLKYRHAGLA